LTSRARVLITDAGRGSAIAVIRSLAKRGMYVIAADSKITSPGFYSKYVSRRVRYPDPRLDADGAVAKIHAEAVEHGVDLIIPVTDDVLLPLSNRRASFKDVSVLALPPPDSLATVNDKARTVELAERLGIPVPRSAVALTFEDARSQTEDFRWPLVIKPQVSRLLEANGSIGAFNVAYAETEADLERTMVRLEGRVGVVLQEYCRGEGVGVGILADRGRPLAAFQHRRLREVPWTGGASSFRESMELDRELYGHATRLLEAVDWTGLAMVEFKVGGGGPKLMEVNGRIWGSFPLAVKSGLDLPSMLADLYLGGTPQAGAPDHAYQTGVRSRDLKLELAWIASVLRRQHQFGGRERPPRHEALAALRDLGSGADGFDVLSRDDPFAGLAEVVGAAGFVVARAIDALPAFGRR
jgi:predicted ATP-grasp superfamily ATP-dependent carboligase